MSPERAESNRLLRVWARTVAGDVLSIGSAKDSDGAGMTYRRYFSAARSYVTSEPTANPWCDRVLDVRSMPSVLDGSFDAVFLSGVLEHVDDCHGALLECHRVLRSDGLLLLGVPFNQPLHRAPQDFWRFTEFGIRYLLRSFVIEDLVVIGDPVFPVTYWARARKA
jgi:SAM-dependent methyltransferase